MTPSGIEPVTFRLVA